MTLSDFINSAVLGAVEGITEFLPISSTAHLTLASELLRIQQDEFQKSYEVVIQVGAILAVMVLYWKRIFRQWSTVKRIAVAFVPTGILGLLLYKVIKRFLLGNVIVVLSALFLGGLFLVVFESWQVKRRTGAVPNGSVEAAKPPLNEIRQLTYRQCLAIGTFQSLAMVPGVSRSAATVVGGLLLGLERRMIVEFSFLLAVPTMCAAAGLDLLKSAGSFSLDRVGFLAVGFVVSFLTALLAIGWLIRYISRNDFRWFGWYRMLASVVLAFWFLR
jgi:undecaprenyl-diphosphatase